MRAYVLFSLAYFFRDHKAFGMALHPYRCILTMARLCITIPTRTEGSGMYIGFALHCRILYNEREKVVLGLWLVVRAPTWWPAKE